MAVTLIRDDGGTGGDGAASCLQIPDDQPALVFAFLLNFFQFRGVIYNDRMSRRIFASFIIITDRSTMKEDTWTFFKLIA